MTDDLDWQDRVIDEAAELDARLTKLTAFIDTKEFSALPRREREDLRSQRYYMENYLSVLRRRIARFRSELPPTL